MTASESAIDELKRVLVLNPSHVTNDDILESDLFQVWPLYFLKHVHQALAIIAKHHPRRKLLLIELRMEQQGRELREKMIPAVTKSVSFRVGGRALKLAADGPIDKLFLTMSGLPDSPYEPGPINYVSRTLSPGDVFFDIGAHVGYYSIVAAASGASVVAVEPQLFLQLQILRNAALNRFRRVTALHSAVGAQDGLTPLPRRSTTPGFSVHRFSGRIPSIGLASGRIDVAPSLTLDTIMRDLESAPSLIKIDAEGAESNILRGATDVIRLRRTRWLIEVHSDSVDSHNKSVEELLAFFDPEYWSSRLITTTGSEVERETAAADFSREQRYLIVEPEAKPGH